MAAVVNGKWLAERNEVRGLQKGALVPLFLTMIVQTISSLNINIKQ